MWEEVKGQPLAVRLLSRAAESGRVAHAYLFHGPEGVGKRLAARILAEILLGSAAGIDPHAIRDRIEQGTHPDVTRVVPEGKVIRIDQIRKLTEVMYRLPVEGQRRIAIIEEADRLSLEAANALLKLLEEPPESACLILTTARPSALLPTIISRTQPVPFQSLPLSLVVQVLIEQGVPAERAEAAAAISGGSIGRALVLASESHLLDVRRELLKQLQNVGAMDDLERLQWAERLEKEKDQLPLVLELMLSLFRDALVLATNSAPKLVVHQDLMPELSRLAEIGVHPLLGMVRDTVRVLNYLERSGSERLALDWLCLRLGADWKEDVQ